MMSTEHQRLTKTDEFLMKFCTIFRTKWVFLLFGECLAIVCKEQWLVAARRSRLHYQSDSSENIQKETLTCCQCVFLTRRTPSSESFLLQHLLHNSAATFRLLLHPSLHLSLNSTASVSSQVPVDPPAGEAVVRRGQGLLFPLPA